MFTQIAAKPTRYNGTVYSSKSEAYFAHMLDLCGVAHFYEPTCTKTGWKPDFLVIWDFGGGHRETAVFEYKPRRVTVNYLKPFGDHMDVVFDTGLKTGWRTIVPQFGVIYQGSWYPDFDDFELIVALPENMFLGDFIRRHILRNIGDAFAKNGVAAGQFRFDLYDTYTNDGSCRCSYNVPF